MATCLLPPEGQHTNWATGVPPVPQTSSDAAFPLSLLPFLSLFSRHSLPLPLTFSFICKVLTIVPHCPPETSSFPVESALSLGHAVPEKEGYPLPAFLHLDTRS